jgi:hypothetical protein
VVGSIYSVGEQVHSAQTRQGNWQAVCRVQPPKTACSTTRCPAAAEDCAARRLARALTAGLSPLPNAFLNRNRITSAHSGGTGEVAP